MPEQQTKKKTSKRGGKGRGLGVKRARKNKKRTTKDDFSTRFFLTILSMTTTFLGMLAKVKYQNGRRTILQLA